MAFAWVTSGPMGTWGRETIPCLALEVGSHLPNSASFALEMNSASREGTAFAAHAGGGTFVGCRQSAC